MVRGTFHIFPQSDIKQCSDENKSSETSLKLPPTPTQTQTTERQRGLSVYVFSV